MSQVLTQPPKEAMLTSKRCSSAGVSGSCWLQTLYNSSLAGRRHDKVIEHLKRRIGVHIAYPPSFLELCTRSPTNKFLLAGTVERLKGDPQANFGLVDVYGLLLSSRLMIPRDELSVDDRDLKLSNQRLYISNGANPLPIYAAVRHEIPLVEHKAEDKKAKNAAIEKAKQEAWFQWFEFTPYELFCEEFEAGIPAWSIGRHFHSGISANRDNRPPLPELRIPFLMGIWGSAFCATVRHPWVRTPKFTHPPNPKIRLRRSRRANFCLQQPKLIPKSQLACPLLQRDPPSPERTCWFWRHRCSD